MTDNVASPPRTILADGTEISRIAVGLWQMADQERDGRVLDLDRAAEALADYARAGFDTWDMADHYGSAEIVAGKAARLLATEDGAAQPVIMTKWCPPPGPMQIDVVRDGVQRALDRLQRECIDVMQFHWWRYEHPDYLPALDGLTTLRQEGLIRHIGLTNFDAAHLHLVVKNGIEIASNQVCFSMLDRRAADALSESCGALGVKLLAFGTLCGGFLSERWLDQPEPAEIGDWSKAKYKRFIDTAGGWRAYQQVLSAADRIAKKYDVSIANVATRWVLDHHAVAASIVGARLGENQHRGDNLGTFEFEFDSDDRENLDAALAGTDPISGDCGDEYRKPPFLTASGDLSHHLDSLPQVFPAVPAADRPNRLRVDSGTEWEAIAGYSRAVRSGNRVLVSGTTATDAAGACVCLGDAAGQTTYILDKIAAALEAVDGRIEDVVRTRIYVTDQAMWPEISRAHGRVFGDIRPANTLIEVAGLVGPYLVEIEAEAEICDLANSN